MAQKKNLRNSTFGDEAGPLGHIGLEGISHIGFMLAIIFPDIRSFLYSIHFWIYRGALFPFKKWKLWVGLNIHFRADINRKS